VGGARSKDEGVVVGGGRWVVGGGGGWGRGGGKKAGVMDSGGKSRGVEEEVAGKCIDRGK